MLEAEVARTISPHSKNTGSSLAAYSSLIAENPGSYYEILGLDRFASIREVEKAFLKKIRHLLTLYQQADGGLPLPCKQEIVSLFIARDVLRDPPSREDYDFQLLSLKRKSSKQTTPGWKWSKQVDSDRMQIGEALVLAELLSPSALQITLELHDTTDHEPFRTFLVENDVVSRTNLESAILGRLLVKKGRLRKASLKRIFKAMRQFGVDFIDSLLVTIDISVKELVALANANELKCVEEAVAKRLEQSRSTAN